MKKERTRFLLTKQSKRFFRLAASWTTLACAVASCGGSDTAATQDPLYRYQWHLKNTGQQVLSDIRPEPGIDLNIGNLHEEGVTGKGVVVGLADEGQAYAQHEDIEVNMVQKDGGALAVNDAASTHATAITAILAAAAGNGRGGRGVAPEAQVLDLSALAGAQRPALRVINNSAGGQPPLFLPQTDAETDQDDRALADPKAPLIVHSAGNSFIEVVPDSASLCEDATRASGVGCVVANTDLLSAGPTVIAVGSVNAAGRKASYSSAGSVLWISGLGGEHGWQRQSLEPGPRLDMALKHPERYLAPAIVTADGPGCERGLNKTGARFNALDSGSSALDLSCNYTALANGTSSAAPMVSGVIALMLQVNPALSWRDIKYILAVSARQVDAAQPDVRWEGATLDTGWTMNAAGHPFSNWYGFGLVDATRAVRAARDFSSLPALRLTAWQAYSGAPMAIPYRREDAGRADIFMEDDLRVETVQLQLRTTTTQAGNLRIVLISPSGTRSVIVPALSYLLPTPEGFSIDLTASNAFLDESSRGNWQLHVVNMLDADSAVTQQLTSWKLRVLGHRDDGLSR